MDDLDRRLIALLRRNARASLSELAGHLGITRATVRTRMARLEASGDVLGYSVTLKGDVAPDPVRGLMMLGVEGRGAERITRHLSGMSEVRAVHSTNGRWDMIVEIGTESLEALDAVLARIRRLDGVSTSETSLLLATRVN
ncbi:Lrp/AsnC family transcriptional regulator [Planktotalea arctica]|uniref:Lrp/AsnC family transcriptional regulator n=1 Tax=Planktotalea arctica TaxID=1481893 RepID=UPI00321A92CF